MATQRIKFLTDETYTGGGVPTDARCLLVMGGSCQRTWEHAVPKTSQPVGPRISVQFRPRGVR